MENEFVQCHIKTKVDVPVVINITWFSKKIFLDGRKNV